MKMTFKYIRELDFVKLTSPVTFEDGALEVGSLFFVMQLKAFPMTEEDPYTQRIKLFVQSVVNEYVDTTGRIFVIDPASVETLSDDENARLYDLQVEKHASTIN